MPKFSVDDLVPKLQAVAEARGGTEARIYVRGDKKVDYGTMMKVMGRLSAAGFHRVALVTEFEQGSKVMECRSASAISTGLHAAVLLWALVSFSGKPLEATPVGTRCRSTW